MVKSFIYSSTLFTKRKRQVKARKKKPNFLSSRQLETKNQNLYQSPYMFMDRCRETQMCRLKQVAMQGTHSILGWIKGELIGERLLVM